MMYLAAAAQNAVDLENISILNAAIVAVLGYAVVFLGLILLMLVIMAMGKAFAAKDAKQAAPAKVPAPVAAPVLVPDTVATVAADAAPGSAGPVKLYDTPPKTAAMIMAIVADQMGKPLNELRFISIKEVKD